MQLFNLMLQVVLLWSLISFGSVMTIMSEGCIINSNNLFQRVDTMFCFEIIIKLLSW